MARTPTSLKLNLAGTLFFMPDNEDGAPSIVSIPLGRLEVPVSVTFRVGEKIIEREPEP